MIGRVRRPPTEQTRRRPARRDTRPRAAAELYDAHGHALLGLAKLLLADRGEAEAVVVHVLRSAGRRRRASEDEADRRNLSRAVYLQATRSRLGPRAEPHYLQARGAASTRWSVGGLGVDTLSEQQRAVIALSLYGGHSHVDTAALLVLPTSVVDELLRSGLHRVRAERS